MSAFGLQLPEKKRFATALGQNSALFVTKSHGSKSKVSIHVNPLSTYYHRTLCLKNQLIWLLGEKHFAYPYTKWKLWIIRVLLQFDGDEWVASVAVREPIW